MTLSYSREPARNMGNVIQGERIFMDIAGGGKITPTKGGSKYLLAFTDEKTDLLQHYLMPSKEGSAVNQRLRQLIQTCKNRGKPIRYLRSDNAKKFASI